jgi:adenosylcobinamide-phosphate synthase
MIPGCDTALAILVGALVWDRLLGEYPAPLHPVVWIGLLISGLLGLAPQRGWWRQLVFGALLAMVVTGATVGLAVLALDLATVVAYLQIAAGIFLLKAAFALRALGAAADRVQHAIQDGNLDQAREALRSLCSRDPSELDAEDLHAAVIESVAENASDSFVAPLFHYVVLGVPGALAYRAINTLDARVGYRGRFEALGKVPARLDDVVNWLPARLTAALLLLAGLLLRKNVAAGWRILRRDGGKTPSPNGGRPMAVMAGLLGVQLAKKGVYVLGDRERPLTPDSVRDAWRLVTVASWLMAGLCAAGAVGVYWMWAQLGESPSSLIWDAAIRH